MSAFPALPPLMPARLVAAWSHPGNNRIAQEAYIYVSLAVSGWLVGFPGVGNHPQFSSIVTTIISAPRLAIFATLYGWNRPGRIAFPPNANPEGRNSDKVLSQAFKAYVHGVFYERGGQAAVNNWLFPLLDYYMYQNPNADWVQWIHSVVAAAENGQNAA